MKIGVFDSGFGGLTVLREFLRELPDYDYLYLGDSARAPYGNKTQEEIYQYSIEAVEYLFKHDCGLIIIACNTVSAEALRRLQQEYLPKHFPDRRVLGVVMPIVEAVVAAGFENIGIIGTEATITSGAYEREIEKINNNAITNLVACPLLVPMIEAGQLDTLEFSEVLNGYLSDDKLKNIDALVLACTHYPLAMKQIKKILADQIEIIDSGAVVAQKLHIYLDKHREFEKLLSKNSERIFATTGEAEKFKIHGQEFLGHEIKEVKQISL